MNRSILPVLACVLAGLFPSAAFAADAGDTLQRDFVSPPETARPWVYWFVMDGNLTREGITGDLEAMKSAGIGGAIYMEVGIGVEPGPVKFMSPEWRGMLAHAFSEADRLGLQLSLAAGPGWCGTGGPWISPEQSMQHLVASETLVTGPKAFDGALPQPKPRTPYFGEDTLTPELKKAWKEFYRDVAVLAFPTPAGGARLADIDEKALYRRDPYSSMPGVKPFLTAPANPTAVPPDQTVPADRIIDLTALLGADGRLAWNVPEGNWTILRFGRTITGQTTRPAPLPGLGLESDKFDRTAMDAHFASYIETLLQTAHDPEHAGRGLTALHFDSWEMGAQNWSGAFREAFTRRRGYDPLRFLPAMTGRVVDSVEVSERFLWDLRQTAQELVVENHVSRLKELGRKHGLSLSLEPYDLNPCSDLTLGAVADVPMAEFWSKGWDFPTEFSCFEAASLGHTLGRPIVAAESFTAKPGEDWQQYPGSMKAQGDWALCAGINRIVFHRCQAQPWNDRFPGMAMGPYGVHWERTETWWDMVPAYHRYLSRCQELLRRGRFVADILYLSPEGAPNVFRPPSSALQGTLPDRPGHNFDACEPGILLRDAAVRDGRIVLPSGMEYRVLVLPSFDTMTPALLRKIGELVEAGATIMGTPPEKSPSLADYPHGDTQVRELSERLWGADPAVAERTVGRGRVIRAGAPQGDAANPVADARWIWYPEGSPAAEAPLGRRFFRRTVELPPDRAVQSARASMTADNRCELSINGEPAGMADNFNVLQRLDVTGLLKPGANTLLLAADNGGDHPNPAGVIAAVEIRFADGGIQVINTDDQWTASQAMEGATAAAMTLGEAGMAPWNLRGMQPWQRDIYPDYALTARVLEDGGVPPDFASDGSLRHIHRRDENADIYFIANREDRAQAVTCRFRVTGRQPEWWDPATGECRDLPEFSVSGGCTSVPVQLARYESGFVVFRKEGTPGPRTGRNFIEPAPFMTVAAPWEVAFDPKWGGPEKTVFETLTDWSQSDEPGIRNYSGKAVYRAAFDLPPDAPKAGVFLALGTVKNMAAVKLNGVDLGVVWCDPWRVAVPEGVLREHGNTLEITVANLWINRLIGDSALPKKKRLTWTTYNPYKPDSPLAPSGLLGPVTLCAAKQS